MNIDIKTLLERILDDVHPIETMVDPSVDLRRGRYALLRRRSAQLAGIAATLMSAVLVFDVILSGGLF